MTQNTTCVGGFQIRHSPHLSPLQSARFRESTGPAIAPDTTCTGTYVGALDGGERTAAQLGINVAPAEVVDNDDVVALIGKVERGGPAAEAVAAEDDDLLLLGGAVGADAIDVGSILESLHNEGGTLGRCGGLAGLRHGRPGSDEGARWGREGRREAGEDSGKQKDLHLST